MNRSFLNIHAFMDGTAGHEKQTLGVIGALARRTDIRVHYRRVKKPSRTQWLRLRARFLGSLLRPAAGPGSDPGVDLVMGTGSHTHIPLLLCKYHTGARAVTCMSPDFPLILRMDLCILPWHEKPPLLARDDLFLTVGPPGTVRMKHRHDPGRGMILVGGLDERRHHWDSDRLLAQIRVLIGRSPDLVWTISSSPRTPLETLERLSALADQHPGVHFYRSQDTPPGWIETAYDRHQRVWVTADSVSMVYEALSAGCRVGLLPVAWKQKKSKFQRSQALLLRDDWVTPYDRWQRYGEDLKPPPSLDEASRCAQEILRRWWPDRLE